MNLLDRFRIKAKLGLIVVISAVALLVALAFAAQTQRQRMIADRIDKIHAIVESACGLAGSLESEVVAGKITREEAMARFHDALHGMWYDGHQDYIGMVTTDGLVRVHPKPGVEGTRGSLLGNGRYPTDEILDVVKSTDEGMVTYSYPKPGETVPQPKFNFVKRFRTWDAVIFTGVYMDDIEAQYRAVLFRLAVIGLTITAVAAATASMISRNISNSLARLKERMERLAAGDLAIEIRETNRQDEIGEMARAVQVFKDNALEKRRIEGELKHEEKLRRTAESLRRSQEHLARAQRIASMGSDVRDIATDAAEWSDESYRIFGVTRETFTPSTENFLALVHPDDRSIILAAHDKIKQGICPAPLEHRIIRPDGATRIVRRETEIIRDAAGKIVSYAGTTQDVTEQRAAQLRQSELERQLLHSQKLDALGTLAGGIAHDLNNTLVPVLGLAKLTMARMAEGNRERGNLAMILKAGERARDLVRQILAFSRKDAPTRDAVDFAALARETFKMLRASLPATVELNEAIDDLPRVLADPAQLHQIVVNLVVNAAQAIGDEIGKITVKLAAAPLGALGTAAPCVHLSVSDTGCGMDEATQQRIFEPFFTTKGVGEGTGLGLSVVHGIVTGHGGRITVTSAPGAGTRFDVLLPAMADDEASSTPTLSAAAG